MQRLKVKVEFVDCEGFKKGRWCCLLVVDDTKRKSLAKAIATSQAFYLQVGKEKKRRP